MDCAAAAGISPLQCEALTAFYNAANGPAWSSGADSGWNATNTPCNWRGVTCVEGNVTALSLNDSGLSGTVPSLNALTRLEVLSLSRNQLNGLPDLSALAHLKELHVDGNRLCGDILLNRSALTSLRVDHNRLSVSDPERIAFFDTLNPGWNTSQAPCPEEKEKLPAGFPSAEATEDSTIKYCKSIGDKLEQYSHSEDLFGDLLLGVKRKAVEILFADELKTFDFTVVNRKEIVDALRNLVQYDGVAQVSDGLLTPCLALKNPRVKDEDKQRFQRS
ncbi:MAG: hypothetical protein GY862_34425, partial [Gammaproteobacteria bacterium]|nr:hypothetical protein [Gammaproteobacteria bacterium]